MRLPYAFFAFLGRKESEKRGKCTKIPPGKRSEWDKIENLRIFSICIRRCSSPF